LGISGTGKKPCRFPISQGTAAYACVDSYLVYHGQHIHMIPPFTLRFHS